MKILTEMFLHAAGEQFVRQAALQTGASYAHMEAALGDILTTLAALVIRKGDTGSGAFDLLTYMHERNFGEHGETNFTNFLHQRNALSLYLDSGNDILQFLLGPRQNAVIEQLASVTQVPTTVVDQLLRISAPLLLQLLDDHVRAHAMTADDLKEEFNDQREEVLARIPPEIRNLLSFRDESVMMEQSEKHSTDPVSGDRRRSLLPWLVLLLASMALLYFLNRGCAKTPNMSNDPPEADTLVTKEVGAPVASTPAHPAEALKRDFAPTFEAAIKDGQVDQNQPYFLNQVTFREGTAELTKESATQLDQFLGIMERYRNVHVRIEAHTDNSGTVKENLETSLNQAIAVKDYLVSRGIKNDRIALVGRGRYKPLFPNTTEKFRKLNQRIEVYLTGLE